MLVSDSFGEQVGWIVSAFCVGDRGRQETYDAQEVTDVVRFDSENTWCGFDITSPRTSCPAVNGSDLLMAKVVSMTGSTRAEAQLYNRQQSSTCVLMQTSLSLSMNS